MTNKNYYHKLRGGYYTPTPIAKFLSDWAIRRNDSFILEPSSGDGVFIESSVEKLCSLGFNGNNLNQQLYSVELDPAEAVKILPKIKRFYPEVRDDIIKNDDFFTLAKQHLVGRREFDCVVGNPPFIRYQNFVEEYRTIAFELMQRLDLTPNRLTNIWVPFLVVSSSLLKSGGRLAMVIPAELFQVNYAGETRKFLTDHFSKLNIVTFRKLVFPKIQQEIILLLAEKNGSDATTISTIEVENESKLSSLDLDNDPSIEVKEMMHTRNKWTYYFLSKENIQFLEAIRSNYDCDLSGKHLDVDVGVVTGKNKFFILKRSDVAGFNLRWDVRRILTRSPHLKGISFDDSDWTDNNRDDYPMYLFMPPNKDYSELRDDVKRYIDYGEAQAYHTGYKCRIRKRWYIPPSIWIPDAFMLRQVHHYPRLVLNNVNATCTDTIHRVRFLSSIEPQHLTAGFLNSMTFAFSELIGRSYGGGVMTFEPSECEKLPFPTVGIERLDFEKVSKLQRAGNIDAVLNITDHILLVNGLGMTETEALKLRNIWKILRDRRVNRKHGN